MKTGIDRGLLVAALFCAVGLALVGTWVSRRLPIFGSASEVARADGELTVLSEEYTIDRIYPSMTGPTSLVRTTLDPESSGTCWIVGLSAEALDARDRAPISDEYVCHVNVDLQGPRRGRSTTWRRSTSSRIFSLSQGQMDIDFPPGFGIPVRSDELLDVRTQALNLNHTGDPFRTRQRVRLRYVQGDEAAGFRPLFLATAYNLVALEEGQGHFDQLADPADGSGAGCCAVGENAAGEEFVDRHGQRFSGHWTVPPGRHEYRNDVTRLLRLPFDTTAHCFAAHLHPFAVSMELVDTTTGESLVVVRAENFPDRIGLSRVAVLQTPDGLPMYADHAYELVTVYDNTSGRDQDAMATLFLYLLDEPS